MHIGTMNKAMTLFLLGLMAIPAGVLAQEELPAGKVKLTGRYKMQKMAEGAAQKTYFQLAPGKEFKLKAGGPTAVLLLARGDRDGRVSFSVTLDDGDARQASLPVVRKISRALYIQVPAGTHRLVITSAKPVWVRPRKAPGAAKPDQVVVAWTQEAPADDDIPIAPLVAVMPETPPDDGLPPPPPLVAARPETPPDDGLPPPPPLVAARPEMPPDDGLPPPPALVDKPPAPMDKPPAEEPNTTKAPPPVVTEAVANPDQPAPAAPAVALDGRPVDVRLRILADRLARGFAQLPGQGRYERIAVATLAESGEAARDLELGALIAVQLSTDLRRDHGFLLLERERIGEVLNEMQLGLGGPIDPSQAAQAGKRLGAQAVIVGTVAEAGADFSVELRLISVEKAEVLAAESIALPRAGLVALAEESVVLRTRSSAVFRSLLVPGWGQFYNREPIKGGVLIGLEVALVGTAIALHFLGASDEDAYKTTDFALKYPDLEPADWGRKAQSLRASAAEKYQIRDIMIYSAIGVHLYNILDAYLFGVDGESQMNLGVVPTTAADLKGNPAPGLGLGLTY